MQIRLYTMNEEKNKLEKTLTDEFILNGNLRAECSVINPIIVVEAENISNYNYMYIPEFGRYYFISDIVSIRTDLWRITATVDVLMSFKDDIKNCPIIVSDALNTDETYISGSQWKTSVKTKTDILNFPSGLNDTGEYILITSGGVASVS